MKKGCFLNTDVFVFFPTTVIAIGIAIFYCGCDIATSEEEMPIAAASIIYASQDRPATIRIAASGSYSNGCGGIAPTLNYRLKGQRITLAATQRVARGICTEAVIDVVAEAEINGLDIGEYVICYKNCIELIEFRIAPDAIYVRESPRIKNLRFVLKKSGDFDVIKNTNIPFEELQNIEDESGSWRRAVVYESSEPVDVTLIAEGYFYEGCMQYLETTINESKPYTRYINISGYVPYNDTACGFPKDPRDIFPSVHAKPLPYYRTEIHLGTLSAGLYYISVNNYGISLLIETPSEKTPNE